jgi:hypothetical protein
MMRTETADTCFTRVMVGYNLTDKKEMKIQGQTCMYISKSQKLFSNIIQQVKEIQEDRR